MSKKIILSLLGIIIALGPLASRADYGASVSYLLNQNQNHWISQALAAQGQGSLNLNYLSAGSDNLMAAAKSLLVVAAVQRSELESGDHWLSVVTNSFDGQQLGSAELLNDDFWGLLALAAVNKESNTEIINDLAVFILSQQNSDGGWSWAAGGESDSNDTAAAIMALLESNHNSSSASVVTGTNYLRSTQNNDGGFAYAPGSDSDGASTAWILATLNKLGANLSDWQRANGDPQSFLNSLQKEDGSFAWLVGDTNGSSLVTAYALVALAGKAYPVNYINIANTEPDTGTALRIEGPRDTICLASRLSGANVLAILSAGTLICDYDYVVEETAFGPYVSNIDGVAAAGLEGWQYWLNDLPGQLSANQQLVNAGDEVLWAYGGFPLAPTKIEISRNFINTEESIDVFLQYHDGQNWLAWPQANFNIGDQAYQTDQSGHSLVSLSSDGVFSVWFAGDDAHIRSNKEYVTVGQGQAHSVNLLVNINGQGGPTPDIVALEIDKSNLDFGDMDPGEATDANLLLSNVSNLALQVEASVGGDPVFVNHLDLNDSAWENYALDISGGQNSDVRVRLQLPADYPDRGQQSGQLVFWAKAR